MVSRVIASSAANGSSISSRLGSWIRPRAMPHPLLHAAGEFVRIMLHRTLQPHGLSRACARAVPAAMSMPMVRIGSSTLSSTFCQGSRVACWNTMPTSRRGPSMACPRSSATPADGLSRPAATLEQGGLAAARGAQYGQEFAFGDRGAESLERRGRAARGPVGHLQALDAEDRCAAIVLCLIHAAGSSP